MHPTFLRIHSVLQAYFPCVTPTTVQSRNWRGLRQSMTLRENPGSAGAWKCVRATQVLNWLIMNICLRFLRQCWHWMVSCVYDLEQMADFITKILLLKWLSLTQTSCEIKQGYDHACRYIGGGRHPFLLKFICVINWNKHEGVNLYLILSEISTKVLIYIWSCLK